MLIFNKDTKHKIKDLNFHDAEITKVICDYDKKRVEMPLKLYTYKNKVFESILIFEDVYYADISFYEPWGTGIYINEVNVSDGIDIINRLVDYQCNIESFCFSILLNSGDKINILTTKMIFE